jgi:hypothetical protein
LEGVAVGLFVRYRYNHWRLQGKAQCMLDLA